jgi:hypothetical protein
MGTPALSRYAGSDRISWAGIAAKEVLVMPEPGNDAAPGPGGMRASRADREQVVETLKAAFVEDRLTKDEFDGRVAGALASRTHADLAALTADLPVEPPTIRPPRKSVQSRPKNPTVRSGARVIAATSVLTGAVWAGAVLSQADAQVWGALVWTLTMLWLGIVILVGSVMIESRRQERSDDQLPPAGGDGDPPSRRALSADPAQPPRARHRGWPRTAEASRRPALRLAQGGL